MTTRVMRDSNTPRDIPARGAQLIAGYGNGLHGPAGIPPSAWTPAAWAMFPNQAHVVIDVTGTDPIHCDVLEADKGTVSPERAPDWIAARERHYGGRLIYPPVLRCARASLSAVQACCAGLDYRLWVITLDGTKEITEATDKPVAAVMWAGQAVTGGHYNESIVYDPTWHAAYTPQVLHGVLITDVLSAVPAARTLRSTDNGVTWR